VVFSGGDPVYNTTPYYAWRSVINAIFELDQLESKEVS